jgi:hypothetical protein
MNETVLWAIAIGTGLLGLLLLAVAGAVAVYWQFVSRGRGERATTDASPTRGGDLATTEPKRVPANAGFANARPAVPVGPWLWIRAWLFAVLHASTVSVVMGGVTFFEDLAKASAEIQSSGTVTFPKQLLPEAVAGPASRKRLSKPTDAPAKAKGGAKTRKSGATPSNSSEWEVVDLVNDIDDDS